MNKQARMIRGEVMSWAMGILLGLMLGIGLLIFANSTAPNPKNDAAKDGAAQTTTAESAATAAEAGNTAKTAGHTDGTGNAATSTSESKEGAPTVADPATTAGGPEASEASTEPATSETASEAVTSEAATAEAGASAAATEAAASTGGAGAASGDPAAGKTVFAGTCGGCHGAQAQGAVGPSLTTEASSWDLAGFKGAVREGKTPDGRTLAPMMPHFSEGQLSDSDLTNIHAWLQSL